MTDLERAAREPTVDLTDHAVNRPRRDLAGRLGGVASPSEDVTETRRLRRRTEDLADRLALALEAGGFGTWHWDRQSGVVEWDERMERLYGLEPGSFDGTLEAYTLLLHPADRDATLATVDEAIRTKSAYVVDHRVVWPDGSVHWLEGKGRVMLDEQGAVIGTIGCTADVTESMHLVLERERDRAIALDGIEAERLSRERLQLLADVNDALNRSDREHDVMHNATRAAVSRLGEWCAMYVLSESGDADPLIEVVHRDPNETPRAQALLERFAYDPDAPTGVAHVMRTGHSEFYSVIDDSHLVDLGASDAARDLARELDLQSSIIVPLNKRGRVLGALQFVTSHASRPFTHDDLALAEVLAARIASTLANRRLSEHQRLIATTLQDSLLPDALPDIAGLQLAVRYWAAGAGTQVGGDFYDVFERDDDWAVVIGDVCGTGPQAASLTGLVRHTIRALAWQHVSHEEVLQHVNRAILRSGRSTFCTAVFGTLARNASGFRFEMAAGGHPLPIVHRRDGTTESVGRPGTLLGAYADPRAFTVATDLAPGETMVLYTDGITDVRPPHDLSNEDLHALVARAASDAASASEVSDRLGDALSTILPIGDRDDDIAILVLRVE